LQRFPHTDPSRRLHVSMMSKYPVKVHFNAESQRFSLNKTSFDELQQNIAKIFAVIRETDYKLTYTDDDNDEITICSDLELAEAFNVAEKRQSVLKLTLTELSSDDFVVIPTTASSTPMNPTLSVMIPILSAPTSTNQLPPVPTSTSAFVAMTNPISTSSSATSSSFLLPKSAPLAPVAKIEDKPDVLGKPQIATKDCDKKVALTSYASVVAQKSSGYTQIVENPIRVSKHVSPYVEEIISPQIIIPVNRNAPYTMSSSEKKPVRTSSVPYTTTM